MNLRESIRRILRENDYSPAGKEVIPNKIVVHKSNPMFRDKILQDGLKVKTGECYKIYVGYGTKCKPAIFATNSTNKRAWFDSTYDDDVWEINTEMIPDVKWFKDIHYESRSKHIVTFQDIPRDAITLKYEGSGSGDVGMLEESIRRILMEERNLTNILKDIIKSFNIFDYENTCGFDIILPEENYDKYNFLDKKDVPFSIKLYFIGGPNSKVWPRTQAVRRIENDIIEKLHDYIKSFFPFNIEIIGSHVNTCDGYEWLMKRKYTTNDLQESIKRILREELSGADKMKKQIHKIGLYQFMKLSGLSWAHIVSIIGVDFLSYKMMADFIPNAMNDNVGGFGLIEIGEDPIPYSSNDNEVREINFLGVNRAIVDVWGGNNFEKNLGEFGVHYYNLPDNILEQVFNIVMTVYEENKDRF